VSGFGPILTPDCPMCGTPGLMRPVIVPLCSNEDCLVMTWDPFITIAQNLANTKVIDDPFADLWDSNPEPPDSGTRVIVEPTGIDDPPAGGTVGS
jgi:hypothetical protein